MKMEAVDSMLNISNTRETNHKNDNNKAPTFMFERQFPSL